MHLTKFFLFWSSILSIRFAKLEAPREVTLPVIKEPNSIRMSVGDLDDGLDPTVLPHIFEPLFTTKATGMGVVLVIVRSIIENLAEKIGRR